MWKPTRCLTFSKENIVESCCTQKTLPYIDLTSFSFNDSIYV